MIGHTRKALERGIRDTRQLGLGVAQLTSPAAAGREDELLLLIGGDLGIGLANLRAEDVDVNRDVGGTHVAITSLRVVRRSHQASASDGRKMFVAVTVAQAATSRPPRTRETDVAPTHQNPPTASSQASATLYDWPRRIGFACS